MLYLKRAWLLFLTITLAPFAAAYVVMTKAVPEILNGSRDYMSWNPFKD